MAAEKPEKKEKKKEKRRSDEAGVTKTKKDKKEKKEQEKRLVAALEEKLQCDAARSSDHGASEDVAVAGVVGMDAECRTLVQTSVPFAVPVADEKGMKKVYKTVRRAATSGTLKRGVKEVVKTLRKSPPSAPGYNSFPGIVIIAGDISPMDVISHLPVLCEDHNVPFIFVTSRAELGASARTKRPTSVVMVMEKPDGKKRQQKQKQSPEDGAASSKAVDADGDADAFTDSYFSLAKYSQKEYSKQCFWAKGESGVC